MMKKMRKGAELILLPTTSESGLQPCSFDDACLS
jgi:hypothetical protein